MSDSYCLVRELSDPTACVSGDPSARQIRQAGCSLCSSCVWQQFRNWLKAIFQEEETCLYVHRSITKSLGARNKHVFNIKYHCARQASTVSIIQFLEAACPSGDTCYIEQSQTASRDGQNKGTLISSNSLS